MGVVRTPGGRVGDDTPHGSTANGENWVERSKSGKLPRYIRIVRNGLMRDGHSEGSATALAVAAIKRWAEGRGNVSPAVQAAAKKALAEWEAMKAGKGLIVPDEKKYETEMIQAEMFVKSIGEARAMGNMEHKAVGISGLKVLGDEDDGIIEAYVSVTGVKDNVNDIIEPGAYETTLKERMPKGIWSHNWEKPVSKALDIHEVMPGMPDLPATLPNGEPWPTGAGALYVKMQFNMKTERGRDAYQDCKFFGDQQEWSIGYNVPRGKAVMDTKTQTRNIKGLNLFEFSPVLWGAMGAARSVKSLAEAQVAHRYEQGEDVEAFLTELKEWGAEHGRDFDIDLKALFADEETELDFDAPEPDDEDDAQYTEAGFLSAENIDLAEKAYEAIGDLLSAVQAPQHKGSRQRVEVKSLNIDIEAKSLCDVLDAIDAAGALDQKVSEDLYDMASDFDNAVEAKDDDAIEESGGMIVELVDNEIDDATDLFHDGYKTIAGALASILTKMSDTDDDEDGEDDEDELDKDDAEDAATRKRGTGVVGPREKVIVPASDLDTKSMRDWVANL